MNAQELVTELRHRGIRLWTENDRLSVEPDDLTEADVATIVALKPAILAFLHAESAARAEPRTCSKCGYRCYDREGVYCESCGAALERPPSAHGEVDVSRFLHGRDPANPGAASDHSPLTSPSPSSPSISTWTRHDVETLLSTVRGRIDDWREHATPTVRGRIDRLVAEFEPAIAGLLAKSDYDSLHYCLIDLQRQIGDSISGYGY